MGKDIMQKLAECDLEPEMFQAYGLEVRDIFPVRRTYRIETSKGTLYLKEALYDSAKMLFVASAMEHLRHNGFPFVPCFEHTMDGRMFINWKGRVYFITEWLNGRECDFHKPDELMMAIQTLARMHEASKGFEPPPGCKIKSSWGRLLEDLHEQIDDLHIFKEMALSRPEKTEVDRLYLGSVDDFLRMAEHSLSFFDEFEYLALVEQAMEEKGFCHCDYTYHNVLIVEDKKYYIVDFDYCRYELHVYDLAKTLRRVIPRVDWNMESVVAAVKGYDAMNPLRVEERKILAGLLWFPQKFWRHAQRYYYQTRVLDERKFIKDFTNICNGRSQMKEFMTELSTRLMGPWGVF